MKNKDSLLLWLGIFSLFVCIVLYLIWGFNTAGAAVGAGIIIGRHY